MASLKKGLYQSSDNRPFNMSIDVAVLNNNRLVTNKQRKKAFKIFETSK